MSAVQLSSLNDGPGGGERDSRVLGRLEREEGGVEMKGPGVGKKKSVTGGLVRDRGTRDVREEEGVGERRQGWGGEGRGGATHNKRNHAPPSRSRAANSSCGFL